MSIANKKKALLNLLIVAMAMMLVVIAASFSSHAISGLEASGYVNCNSGAILRAKASTKSSKLAGLPQGAPVEVQKEVFVHKTKRSAKYRWYLVNTGAGVGYIRSDLVTITNYGSASGVTTKKIAYRKGAGTKMTKKGNIGKKKSFAIVLEAKAKGSSAVWYKIYRNGGFYYVKRSNTQISSISSGLPQTATAPTPASETSVALEPADTVVQSAEALRVVDGACAWAIQIAADNRFHYGLKPMAQHNGCYFCGTQTLIGGRSKLGVNDYEYSYCCNPFVHAAFAHGGGEQAMLQICQKGSSYDYHKGKGYDASPLFAKLGKPAMSKLKKGDVICSNNHVMLYVGNGMVAEAAGGDDNVPGSDKWNNSIRVTTLSESRYAKYYGVFRYIGNQQ